MFLEKKEKNSSPRVSISLLHLSAIGKTTSIVRKYTCRNSFAHLDLPRRLLLRVTSSRVKLHRAIAEGPSRGEDLSRRWPRVEVWLAAGRALPGCTLAWQRPDRAVGSSRCGQRQASRPACRGSSERILISLSQKFRLPPKLPNFAKFGQNFAEIFLEIRTWSMLFIKKFRSK
jgi:hypothetical protein